MEKWMGHDITPSSSLEPCESGGHVSDLSSWLLASLLIVVCHSKSSLSPTTMAPANVLKCKETELEHEMRIFNQTELIIDRAVLDQALALQVEEQVHDVCAYKVKLWRRVGIQPTPGAQWI